MLKQGQFLMGTGSSLVTNKCTFKRPAMVTVLNVRMPMRASSEMCFKIQQCYLNPELEPTRLILTGPYLGCSSKYLCVCEFIDEESELRMKPKGEVASSAKLSCREICMSTPDQHVHC
ncbi:hypothetical protein DVH24_032464 [Malus domestica]|uniref:Uncharacterized protein n=1 Tax=Malus domestica TaxID=3750 RepID=A0A498J615_MALDO|nr:hypothetical protein DVH24_032464 [Malus domestica]